MVNPPSPGQARLHLPVECGSAWKCAQSTEDLSRLSCSVMPDSLRPHGLCSPCQAPLSMGFSRQEHWSGLPLKQIRPGAKHHLLRATPRTAFFFGRCEFSLLSHFAVITLAAAITGRRFLCLTGVELLYNVVLVSAIQRHESAICIHTSPPSRTSLPPAIPPI